MSPNIDDSELKLHFPIYLEKNFSKKNIKMKNFTVMIFKNKTMKNDAREAISLKKPGLLSYFFGCAVESAGRSLPSAPGS